MNKAMISYDSTQDQWYCNLQGREYGLHCGESFELYIGDKAIPCRMELASKWYVIMEENARFDLRESDQYTIKL